MAFRRVLAPRTGDLAGAPEHLSAVVDRGLHFYWTLASVASEAAGGARVRVDVDSDGGGDSPCSPDVASGGQRPQWPGPLPREPRVSLRMEPGGAVPADGEEEPALDGLARTAGRLLAHEHAHRALRYVRAEARASESQAAHDLRALLQPLVLHTDQLRRARGPTEDQLDLLDDLTRSIVDWVESRLRSGALQEEVRLPSPARAEPSDPGAVLEEALAREDPRGITAEVSPDLPGLDVDRPLVEAGLAELLRLGRNVPRRLHAAPAGDGPVAIAVELEREPGSPPSAEPAPDGEEYPPVTGGLLNLVALTGGALRIETGGQREAGGGPGRIEVRLPAADRSADDGAAG